MLAKTKVVVFNQTRTHVAVTYARGAIEQVDRYKYLGIVMHQSGTLTHAVEGLRRAGQRAVFALHSRCAELGITDVRLRCRLYDAVVRPVLSYGCEVWAPLCAKAPLRALERIHLGFLRRVLGVPRATPDKFLYAETGRLPHQVFWWQHTLHGTPTRLR